MKNILKSKLDKREWGINVITKYGYSTQYSLRNKLLYYIKDKYYANINEYNIEVVQSNKIKYFNIFRNKKDIIFIHTDLKMSHIIKYLELTYEN